jgi:tetratricopeptide (TPR) repeat protein
MILCDFEKSEGWLERAVELEPDMMEAHQSLIGVLLMQRRFDEAISASEYMLAVDPDDPRALGMAGNTYLFAGDNVKAGHYYERTIDAVPRAALGPAGIGLAYVYWNSGRGDEARDLIAEALGEAEADMEDGADDMFTPFNIASVYGLQGEKDLACSWLRKSIDAGWLNYLALMNDPLFECLHEDARFKDMMTELKAAVDEMRARADQQTQR